MQKTLADGGVSVVEIPRKVKYVGVHVGDQRMKVETDWGTIDAYFPRHEEMVEYGQLAGFVEVQLIDYQTKTNLDRSLYLFKK